MHWWMETARHSTDCDASSASPTFWRAIGEVDGLRWHPELVTEVFPAGSVAVFEVR